MKEIVIKIPDEALSFVYQYGFVGKEHRNALNHAILQCTELPKGHGELKDQSTIFEAFDDAIETAKKDEHFYANAFESGGEWCAEYESIISMIKSVKPLVEADKGEE